MFGDVVRDQQIDWGILVPTPTPIPPEQLSFVYHITTHYQELVASSVIVCTIFLLIVMARPHLKVMFAEFFILFALLPVFLVNAAWYAGLFLIFSFLFNTFDGFHELIKRKGY